MRSGISRRTPCTAKPESLLLEGKLIKEYRPRYNISFRDDKRFLVVKVDPTEEWPRFRLARFKKDDGARYFGPYAHAGALRQTLNFMRKKFGVLTFGRGSPTERELKSATYQVPMRLSEITTEQYRERVAQACDFLEGHSREMIAASKTKCARRPRKMDFEKAAELRNMLEDLRRTTKPTRRFTRHSLPSAIDPVARRAGAGRRAATDDVCRRDGVLRYLEHLHDARGGFDGLFPQRRSGQGLTIAVIEFGPSKARMILRAWPKSLGDDIRACCLKRARRIRKPPSSRRKIRGRRRCNGWKRGLASAPIGRLFGSDREAPARDDMRRMCASRSDHCGWRERAVVFRVPRIAAAWVCTICRLSGWRRNMRKFIGRAALCRLQLPPDSGALRLLATNPRRSASFREHLSPTADEKTDRRKHSRRLPGRESEPEKSAPAKIRFGQSTAKSERGRDRGHRRHRAEIGRGSASIPASGIEVLSILASEHSRSWLVCEFALRQHIASALGRRLPQLRLRSRNADASLAVCVARIEETIVPTFETQKLARTYVLDIPAPRGQITDRNGVPLAQNKLELQSRHQFSDAAGFFRCAVAGFCTGKNPSAPKSYSGARSKISDDLILRHYHNRGILPLRDRAELQRNRGERRS